MTPADDLVPALVVALLGATAMGLLAFLLLGLERRGLKALTDLAERRGLLFDEIKPSRGAAGRYRFTDTARGLVLEVTLVRRSGRTSQTNGQSVLTWSGFRLPGALVVMPGAPPGLGTQLAQVQGFLGGALIQKLLARVLGEDLARALPELREIPAPEGANVTVMTSLAEVPPLAPLIKAQQSLPTPRSAVAGVTVTQAGVMLRVSTALTRVPEVEAMLDAGLALREALR